MYCGVYRTDQTLVDLCSEWPEWSFAFIAGFVLQFVRWSFMSDFRTVFPIASIDGLSEGTKVSKVIGFAYLGDLVLNPGQKSIVELALEWRVSPLDSCS